MTALLNFLASSGIAFAAVLVVGGILAMLAIVITDMPHPVGTTVVLLGASAVATWIVHSVRSGR